MSTGSGFPVPGHVRDHDTHPPLDYPGYRSTALRHPQRPLTLLPHMLTEITSPVLGEDRLGAHDHDLTRQHDDEPQGQRVIVHGQVRDSDGRPVPYTLVEIRQANAAGRYLHTGDDWPAPLDPNFGGVGRVITDAGGRYRFVTVRPGASPWKNHRNAWRPAHIHFSLFGRAFTQRLVTQMYFPDDPLFFQDPMWQSVPDEKARERMLARFDHDTTELASLDPNGPAVAAAFAARLDLPWHTERGRVTEVAAALGRVCGAAGTVAQDIVLLAQTEVGELTEDGGSGAGGSSTMPHKRNPIAAVSALAAARQAPGLVATLFAAQIQEHQRAAGSWHAEWLALTDLLRRTGSVVSWLRVSVQRLRVHPDRMRANLDLIAGLALSERVTTDLAPELGRLEAHRRVTAACRAAVDEGRDPAEAMAEHLRGLRTRDRIRALLDPAAYLGAAPVFTDRVTGRTGRTDRTENEEGTHER